MAKLTRREIELLQEAAWDEKRRLEKMSQHDPKREEVTDEMVKKAQKCGYAYREYLRRQGRNITWKEDDHGRR